MPRRIAYNEAMAGTTFKDHFSRQAAHYAANRPRYPQALFEVLAALAGADQAA